VTTIAVGGRALPLDIRVSPRSRRLTLRLDGLADRVVVVVPPGVPRRDVLAFTREKEAWLAARLDALPPRIPFAAGSVIPLLGEPHLIRHAAEARRGVWAEDGVLHVSGRPEHLARRLRDHLIKRAKAEIAPRAHAHAETLGRRVARLSLRDPRSRWGSCSAEGALSFSWRLVLAPGAVLDYVVAHEAAHLAELNHSRRFWAVVDRLAGDTAAARSWLKEHGTRLHRYG
jgi:predicted metal-dependent hydrolase